MNTLRKTLLYVLPSFLYTLIVMIVYGFFASEVYNNFDVQGQSEFLTYYFKAGTFVFYLILLRIIDEKLKSFASFFLSNFALIFIYYLAIQDIIIIIIAVLALVLRITSHFTKIANILDNCTIGIVITAIAIFALSLFKENYYIQVTSLLTAIFTFFLCFCYKGLKSVDEYLYVNKAMANLPKKRIENFTSKFFMGITFSVLIVFSYLCVTTFQLTYIELSSNVNGSQTEEYYRDDNQISKLDKNQSSNEENAFAEIDKTLKLWDGRVIFSYIGYAIAFIFLALILVFGFIKLRVNFNKSIVYEQNDIIESTDNDDYQKINYKEEKKEKLKFFDMSPNAVIRKKYINTIKKRKVTPENWQTPSEIEDLAKINVKDLHTVYEKARYSKDGCTKEDIEKTKMN